MQYKTSMREFEPYGSVYEEPINQKMHNMISRVNRLTPNRTINQLLHFEGEVYLEMKDGMAAIVIGFSPDADDLKVFSIHRKVRLNPGVYFAVVSVSSEATCRLITSSGFSMETIELDHPYYFNRVLPHIQIREIFGYYYNVRNAGYNFQGEKHDYYELTFVDRGTLETTIENKQFIINEKELMIYGPEQFHTQHIAEGQSCSYVTILFSMVNVSPDAQHAENDLLLNKVFSYDKKIYTLLKDFVQESSVQIPYINSLMTCLLQEIIIRLLRSEFLVSKEERPVSLTRQHYQDELLERILNYIEQSICEPLTIAEICQKFSISRSSLQLLFKENLDQTPKKYISDMKLEKSCQLIREQKYSISEISLLLGFNSIHYFSRAFAHKYNMAPSEYSKQMFNQF